MDLPTLVRAEKRIPGNVQWVLRDPRWLALTASVDIDGVTVAGLSIRGKALLSYPEGAVTLQLQFQAARGKAQHLVRAEWKPIKPHTNSGRGPADWRFKSIPGSHIHRFDDNYLEHEHRMYAGAQQSAVPLPEIVDSYERFLEFCGKEFRVNNMDVLPAPPWQPRML